MNSSSPIHRLRTGIRHLGPVIGSIVRTGRPPETTASVRPWMGPGADAFVHGLVPGSRFPVSGRDVDRGTAGISAYAA